MHFTCCLFFLSATLLFSEKSHAQTLYVDSSIAVSGNGSSWASAYKELRDAVHFAADNSSITDILIAKGSYKPTTDTNLDSSFCIFRGNIKLIGGYPSGGGTRDVNNNQVKLDGFIQTGIYSRHVLVLAGLPSGADSVVFDGIRVINGQAITGTSTKIYNGQPISANTGGGLCLLGNLNGNVIAVRNCFFTNNNANTGSGVYNRSTIGSPVFSNCSFIANIGTGNLSIGTNSYGTGMYNYQSSPVISNCTFTNNTMNRSGYGRGIYNESCTSVISNCSFSGNSGGSLGVGSGGAVYDLSSTVSVSNCSFINNITGNTNSDGGGGGIYNESSVLSVTQCYFTANVANLGAAISIVTSAGVKISNCTFSANKTSGLGSDGGGGIYTKSSAPIISNCIFIKDTCSRGSGLYCVSGSLPLISNCTFYGNLGGSSSSRGNAVYCADSSGGKFSSCIFWKDTALNNNFPGGYEFYSENDGSKPLKPRPALSYSIVRFGLPISNVIDSGGNQSVYPLFQDTINIIGADNIFGSADDGLRLQTCSPGIDAGLNSAIPAGITTDIKGDARINNATVDIGAYENPGPSGFTGVAINADSTTKSINGSLTITSGCRTIATVVSSGANPVTNGIKVKVTIDNTVQTFNGYPYVQRHYDLEPISNATTATAGITLYYTQAEFTAYNLSRGIYPSLPVDAADAANYKANINIHQFHGSAFGAGSTPANYPSVDIVIIPTLVTWNAATNLWEVSFNVTGFSGFFLNTVTTPIPIVLEWFTGSKQTDNILFSWKAACSNSPYTTFTLERSNEPDNFTSLFSTQVNEQQCMLPLNYTDIHLLNGKSFYRLKMTDANGKIAYSNILFFNTGKQGDVYVSPTLLKRNQLLHIGVQQKGYVISIYTSNGALLKKQELNEGINTIDMRIPVAGVYFYRINDDGRQEIKTGQLVIE